MEGPRHHAHRKVEKLRYFRLNDGHARAERSLGQEKFLREIKNSVNSLLEAIDLLFHPSIRYTERVQEIFRHLIHTYYKNNGKADPDPISKVLVIRMQQQVKEVRNFDFNRT